MSLPRYAEYKDSEVEWLGDVPAHWQLAKIRAFTRFCGGGTPSRENLSYWNGDIPWVSPKDMKVERITVAAECITETGLRASTSSMVDAGSLLIVVRSGILKHTIPVAINDVPVALNQDMKALSFDERFASSEFLMRWVQGLNELLLLAWAKQGATVESIEHSYLSETVVPLPSREEQKAITAFLDRETARIDALIAEQETLLALLAEKRQATISHAITRGLDPNVAWKDSGIAWLGEVPAHWQVANIKRLCDLITDGAHVSPETEGGTFHFVSTKDVGPKGIDFDRCLLTSAPSYDYLVKMGCRPLKGDVLFSKDGTIGRTTVVRELTEFVVASSLIIIRPTADCLDSDFLDHLCQSMLVKSQVDGFVKGAGLPRLSIQNLLKVVGVFPPLNEQRDIARYLAAYLERNGRLEDQVLHAISALKERRSALISAAVTGQIDVRGLVSEEAA